MNKKEKKNEIGITLIALVITIIVLLILAGVSIATLTGQNGILTQAQNAAEQTEIANAKEQAQLDILAWQSDKLEKGESTDLDNSIIKGILTGKDYVGTAGDESFTTKDGKYEIPYSELYQAGSSNPGGDDQEGSSAGEEVAKPSTWPENDKIIAISDGKGNTIPLPNDFNYVGGDKETGLVISDVKGDDLYNTKQGNQFVWIPVDDYSKFVRQEGYYKKTPQSYLSYCGEAGESGTNSKVEETTTTQAEAVAMYKSVKDYGGFYIGRFETGKDESGKAVIRKGVTPYNSVPWSVTKSMTEDGDIDGTENGAIEQARYFATLKEYTSVTSTLCYSVQWDAALNYIDPNYITNAEAIGKPSCEETSYVRNSDGKGWYDQSNPTNTGYYQVKNIYDLAGNVREWTMESYSTDGRVFRGGYYNGSGSNYPSSYRGSNDPDYAVPRIGFRTTLYL